MPKSLICSNVIGSCGSHIRRQDSRPAAQAKIQYLSSALHNDSLTSSMRNQTNHRLDILAGIKIAYFLL